MKQYYAIRRPRFLGRPSSNPDLVTTLVSPDERWLYRVLFVGVIVLLLVPIWLVQNLPLVDYPQTLARGYIAAHYEAVPLFQRLYEPPLNVATNRAFEALAFVFGRAISLDVLGRLFISMIIVLFASSCHFIPRLYHGRASWLALPMIFFIYSTHLIYGSINFLLGLSAFLLVFASWRSLVGKFPVRAAILLLVASPILFLIHMAAYVFEWPAIGIALLFALREPPVREHPLRDCPPGGRRITFWQAALQFVPLIVTLALFQLFFAHGGAIGPIAFNSPFTKVTETLTLISTYRRTFDVFFAIALLAILIYAYVSSRLRFVPEAAAIGAAFYLLLLLCPGTIFAASGADVRFLIPAFVFAVASVDFTMPLRSFRIAFAAILLLFTVRLASIAMDWQRMSDWLAPQLALFARVPEGSRVYPMYYEDSVSNQLERRLFPTFGVYEAVKHHADPAGLLTIRSGSQVGGHYLGALENPPNPDSVRAILDSFDYLWCYRPRPELKEQLDGAATLVASAGDGELLHVK